MDEHVHRAITNALKLRNVDVLTVQEDCRTGAADQIILDPAIELERVIFTQDDDFLTIANYFQQQGIYFTGVIYAHQQSVTVGDCVRDLEIIAKAAEKKDLANQVQYLHL
jgi:predicted nuclease of predicted toxin-antitoxin system